MSGSSTAPRSRRQTLGEVIRFGLVGVANTVSYYALYLVLLRWLPYLAAHLLAWAGSVVVSFFLNCRFTYRVRPTWRRFLMYPLTTLVNVCMTTFGVYALVEWASVGEKIAPLVAGILAIPATFVVTRLVLTSSIHDDASRD